MYVAYHTILLQIQLPSDIQFTMPHFENIVKRIDYIFLIMILKTYNIFDR